MAKTAITRLCSQLRHNPSARLNISPTCTDQRGKRTYRLATTVSVKDGNLGYLDRLRDVLSDASANILEKASFSLVYANCEFGSGRLVGAKVEWPAVNGCLRPGGRSVLRRTAKEVRIGDGSPTQLLQE